MVSLTSEQLNGIHANLPKLLQAMVKEADTAVAVGGNATPPLSYMACGQKTREVYDPENLGRTLSVQDFVQVVQ